MKIQIGSKSSTPVQVFFFFLLSMSFTLNTSEANTYEPSVRLWGKNPPSKFHGTKAKLTLNSFQKGRDGGGPSECDGKFHSDDTRIVALSTRWFEHKKRCQKSIIINANGRSVKAKVVDECDSRRGCPNNIVDASKAVWEALGVPKKDWGLIDVTWSDT